MKSKVHLNIIFNCVSISKNVYQFKLIINQTNKYIEPMYSMHDIPVKLFYDTTTSYGTSNDSMEIRISFDEGVYTREFYTFFVTSDSHPVFTNFYLGEFEQKRTMDITFSSETII